MRSYRLFRLFDKLDESGLTAKYDPLSEHADQESASRMTSPWGYLLVKPPNRYLVSPIPWIISTIVFASLTAFQLYKAGDFGSQGTFENGFATDLAAARSHISINRIRFQGSPSFTADGEELMPVRPDEIRYVGEPTQEIDDAWDALTQGRYFLLTEKEARDAWGAEYKQFWDEDHGGYLSGFDMLHTLHCLDHIRQAFYPEHYPQTPIHGLLHRDHCINHLRQMVQCYGDITPIPTRYYPGVGHNYIDSNRVHTCRNFDQLRAWTTKRYNGSLAVDRTYRGYH